MLMVNAAALNKLFKIESKKAIVVEDAYFKEIFSDKALLDILFDSKYDICGNECCKSKDKTCATIECSHNFNRNGSGAYYDKYY